MRQIHQKREKSRKILTPVLLAKNSQKSSLLLCLKFFKIAKNLQKSSLLLLLKFVKIAINREKSALPWFKDTPE